MMLKRFEVNKTKSAILSISSLAGVYGFPFISVYSATKAFNDAFSRSLDIEYSDKIDILSVKPGMVNTSLLEGKNKS